MAITTYAELQTACGNFLDRTDLSSRIPEFIVLFEAVANRRLRVREQLASTDLTPSSGVCTLPSDYLEWKRVTRLATNSQNMEWMEPEFLSVSYPHDQQLVNPSTAPGGFFTIEGASLIVKPEDDSVDVQLLYYQSIPALSAANQSTHWLFTKHPDIYLAGMLGEATLFTEAPEQAQIWLARRDAGFAEIERLSKQSQGRASVRTFGPTP